MKQKAQTNSSDFKHSVKNFRFTFITILCSFIIIFIGYHTLDIAGNYFLLNTDKISISNKTDNNSYIFYSQTDNDILIFPWNYYKESLPLTEEDKIDDGDTKYSLNKNFITSLYTSINSLFYETISPDLSVYLYKNNSTLYDELNFDFIFDKLLTYTDSEGEQYFFYNENKTINDTTYNFSFAFDRNIKIYSFKCREVYSENTANVDTLTNGYTYLNHLINNGDISKELPSLCEKNSEVISYDEASALINPTEATKENIEADIYINDYKNENDTYSDTEVDTNTSYQIIESNGEYLLISLNEMIVYYFDPVQNKFTGFNYIY